MKFSSFLKTFSLTVLFILAAFVLTGCGPDKAPADATEMSAQGVVLEDYLPSDTLMSVSLNTFDDTQRAKLDQLKSLFPQEDFNNLYQSLTEELSMQLESSGITYENDIQPVLGDKFRFLFGMAGQINTDTEPNVYFALTVTDTAKANDLLNKIADSNSKITKEDIDGNPGLTDGEGKMFLVLYKDTVLITNNSDTRLAAVERVRDDKESLRSNEHYKDSMKELPAPNLGTAYISISDLFTALENVQGEENVQKMNLNVLESMYAEAFAFYAEDGGIRMLVNVSYNPDAKEFNFNDFPYSEPYMFTKLPGKNLVVYSESNGLNKVYDLEKQLLLTTDDDKKSFDAYLTLIKQYIGLDLEQDVISWMDKGFALEVQRNEGIVPGISLYIDANSNPDKAKAFAKVIDTAVNQIMENAQTQAQEGIPTGDMYKLEPVSWEVRILINSASISPS